jgi:outer membrane protein TolC
MIAAAEAKVKMAQKEYYPDFTINAGYFKRAGEFMDMWSLTSTINIPLFYKTKQRQAVLEAEANLSAARYELEATKYMISSGIRDNYSMYKSAEKLMELYRSGLIPKTYQDFESAIAGYTAGKIEAITAINRLKTLIDLEMSYWVQLVEREKAMARFEAIAGTFASGPEVQK